MPSLRRTRESVRTSLWFVPTLFALAAVGLWALMRAVDQSDAVETLPLGFGGGPAGAREVLSAISTSMIAFTGVVFSVTIVALQLASSQYTPRILRTFLRDRRTQAALGSFIATFVYALLVLRGVRGETAGAEAFVPRLSVSVAFVLLAASLAMFVVYIHQIAQSIRGTHIVARVGDETRACLERLRAEDDDAPAAAPRPRALSIEPSSEAIACADRPGYVLGFETNAIVRAACAVDACVVAVVRPGDFVATGQTLLAVVRSDVGPDDLELQGAVAVGQDRAMDQDPRFGFRQLVDIALRALSPGLNDPTTAVQCVDQLHDLLRRVVRAPFPTGEHHDDDGRLRFIEDPIGWADLVDLAFTEIVLAGDGQVQLRRRLVEVLDDLERLAAPDRRWPIEQQRRRLGTSDPDPSRGDPSRGRESGVLERTRVVTWSAHGREMSADERTYRWMP